MLEWLRTTALDILRSDQWVLPAGFSLSGSIVTAFKGGLRPGRVASRFEPDRAARKIALAPSIDSSLGLAGRPKGRRHTRPLRQCQNDPRPPNQLLRRVPARHPALKEHPILRGQPNA